MNKMCPSESEHVTSPRRFHLHDNEVHVWRTTLRVAPDRLRAFESLISDEEWTHAAHIRSRAQRNEFIAARATLRDVLGCYVGVPAGRLRFVYGCFGKPALSREFSDCGIKFNMSHSGGLAVLAVSKVEVGVDVERVDPTFAEEQIAERLFSVPEISSLRCLPLDLQPEAFFNCWTRKEAYLKAAGVGICGGLDAFDVSVKTGAATVIRSGEVAWWIQGLVLGPEYIGAVAIEGTALSITIREWNASPCT